MSVALDICVCTFRRASLADTLCSLAALEVPDGVRLRVVVVDNDDVPSAEAQVTDFAATQDVCVKYVHRPGRNISLARNAALDASGASLLAFIDDDETAEPNWIAALLAQRRETKAEVVLGPVRAIYPASAPKWMQRADIHATRPVWVRGAIRTGYSCNVLIDRTDPAIAAARFDPELGKSGGEDSFYFRALTANGAKIAYAPEAWVNETVTQARLSLRWLIRRRLRMGQTHALSLLVHERRARVPSIALAAVKALACGVLATLYVPRPHRALSTAMRACLHVGVVAGLAGSRPLALYGDVS